LLRKSRTGIGNISINFLVDCIYIDGSSDCDEEGEEGLDELHIFEKMETG
jgi:hypothetical protein